MKETYGIFKKFAADNHYSLLTKAVNSAFTTRDTASTMKKLSEENGHGGCIVIKDGICYTTYMAIQKGGSDSPYNSGLTLMFAKFSLERAEAEDFDAKKDVTYHLIGKTGSEFLGHKAVSNLKCPSMYLAGEDIYICFNLQTEEGYFQMFRIVYSIKTDTFGREKLMKVRYRGKLYDFNDETTNMIYVDKGLPRNMRTQVELVAQWSEYRGEYYTTYVLGGHIPNNGLVIKTGDFETVEVVSILPENRNGSAEASSYIFKDKLYVACRQNWTLPYMLIMRYDLEKEMWTEAYQVEDANARPWFFVYKDELYLYNTIEEGMRRYANISKVRVSDVAHNKKNAPIDTVATIFDCGNTPVMSVYQDRIYMICTHEHQIWFGELKLKQYSEEAVNNRLMQLFDGLEE